jgi:hypothetical protein
VWAVRNWHLEVRYHMLHRPHLQVTYLYAAPRSDAERAARKDAALRIRERELQDATNTA